MVMARIMSLQSRNYDQRKATIAKALPSRLVDVNHQERTACRSCRSKFGRAQCNTAESKLSWKSAEQQNALLINKELAMTADAESFFANLDDWSDLPVARELTRSTPVYQHFAPSSSYLELEREIAIL
eukprot:scaffold437_cov111-Cylindrotheca_fusiformis.AAC.6